MFFFIASLLLPVFVFSNTAITPYIASEDNTFALVDQLVNAQSGKLVQTEKEISIAGSDPLELVRYYDGAHHFDSEFGYGMGLSLPLLLELKDKKIGLWERQGTVIPFEAKSFRDSKKDKKYFIANIDPKLFEMGYTNCGAAAMRGEPSSHATRIRGDNMSCVVILSNGIKRHYICFRKESNRHPSRYRLTREERPNGNVRHFTYTHHDSPEVASIETKDRTGHLTLNHIDFTYEKHHAKVMASNGQTLLLHKKKYHGKYKDENKKDAEFNKYLVAHREAAHLPKLSYDYKSHSKKIDALFSMKEIKRPNGQKLSIEYDGHNRVKKIYSGDLLLYTFEYHPNATLVRNAIGALRTYHFGDKHLIQLDEPHRRICNHWVSPGLLACQTIKTIGGTPVINKKFSYEDSRINVLDIESEICRAGVISRYIIGYQYNWDDIHALSKEVHNGRYTYEYSYLPNTNLRLSKISSKDGSIFEREFYDYDAHGFLIEEILDDGTSPDKNDISSLSCRKITKIEPECTPDASAISLPKVIREGYLDPITCAFVLLKKHERFYDKAARLIEEKIYDANDNYAYSLCYSYNNHGELISETNALGEISRYAYDDHGNKIYEEKHGFSKRFRYNAENLLIEEVELHGNREFQTAHRYDSVGNRIVTSDHHANTTWFHYDPAGRKIREQDPYAYDTFYEYDIEGRVTKKIDKEGHATSTRYNLYGSPLEIRHPDGTLESFIYTEEGHLIEKYHRDGSFEKVTIDPKGRPLVTEIYSENGTLLQRHQKEYRGQNLIREIDPRGYETKFEYDGAGRKVASIEGERITRFAYDSLGRLTHTITPSSIESKVYDLLDRVIEESTTDASGKLFSKIQYSYDTYGNRIETKTYVNEDSFLIAKELYDTQNRLIRKIDPQGAITEIRYHQTNHLEVETIDPLGRKVLEIYGENGELRKKRITAPSGELIASTTLEYDRLGQKILHLEKVFGEGLTPYDFTVRFTYDSMGQKTSQVEQDARTTRYTYHKGHLATQTLPDGVVITNSYDGLGRLIARTSSDGTIDERFTFDAAGNCTLAEDLLNNISVTSTYDRFHNRIYEKQPSGVELYMSYDDCDRLTNLSFLDEKITYSYNPACLQEVIRFHKNTPLYRYSQSTDFRGKILENGLDNVRAVYTWNLLGALTSLSTPTLSETYSYDTCGRLISHDGQDSIGSYQNRFAYDDLDQLISESGHFNHTYRYDSLYNRRAQNNANYALDSFNQVTDSGTELLTYDTMGRRASQGTSAYTYDALGRLRTCKNANGETRFEYDPFGRRISIEENKAKRHFLYLFENEIGQYDGTLLEFRAIHGKESAFAIELNGTAYSPIRNYRGDIVQLINASGEAQSTTRYDSFGNSETQGTIPCPWQFLGRRCTLGLYHFDNRDYDPHLGRWTTPDPAGLIDGPNLYAYVKNSPWKYTDPYGLYIEETTDFVHGFAHGCLDGVSFGGYSAFTGSFQPRTSYGAWGEGAGTVATFLTPMGFASAELRGCFKTVQVVSKTFRTEQTLTRAAQIQSNVSNASFRAANNPNNLARLQLLSEAGTVANEGAALSRGAESVNRATSFAGSRHFPLEYAPYQTVRNSPAIINGRNYSGHALDRMQDRGFFPSLIENSISNGKASLDKIPGRIQYHDSTNKIRVIAEESGKVITVVPGRG